MATYTTLDYLDDLTPAERQAARLLGFVPAQPNQAGWDFEAVVSGVEPGALLRAVFRFTAVEGATYDIFSLSYFDPFLLRVFDAEGNAIVANDEADDPDDTLLQDGGWYSWDALYDWRAPYTGEYYVQASWDQGSFYTFHTLQVMEDRGTAGAPAAPASGTGTAGDDVLNGTAGADTLTGLAGDDVLNGFAGDDVLIGGPGNDVFDAADGSATGRDRYEGGPGNDLYVIGGEGNDTIIELAGEGFDSVFTRASFSLGGLPHVENLFAVSAAGLQLTGNALGNILVGDAGNDILTGGGGDDDLDGEAGSDTAVFSGPLADYSIQYFPSEGAYVVQDRLATRDGTDTVFDVEFFRFADGVRAVSPTAFDTQPPQLTALSPADEATGVPVASNLTLTFNEPVQRGVGNLALIAANGTVVETFNAATSPALTVSGSTVVVNPTADLAPGTTYRLEIATGAVRDLAGNAWAGSSSWNFATQAGDDFAASTQTSGRAAAGTPVAGTVNFAGDVDWFAVTLTAGRTYRVDLTGGTLGDPLLTLLSGTGAALASDDDSGPGLNAQLTFVAATSGTHFLAASGLGGGVGTYTLLVTEQGGDDFAGSTATAGRLAAGGNVSGSIERAGDEDWFAITLQAGTAYRFTLNAAANAPLDPLLVLRSATGASLASNDDSGGTLNSLLNYTPASAGTYYLSAQAYAGTGAYTLSAQALVTDDYAATTATTGRVSVGGSTAGRIEAAGDADWLAVTLTAGETYRITLNGGPAATPLSDPLLRLLNSAGSQLAQDDDSGEGLNALLTFRATTTGTHYLEARAYGSQTGSWTLAVAREGGDDHPASTATTGRVAAGGSVDGTVEQGGDRDWFAVELVAGRSYQFSLNGVTLADPFLTLRHANGSVLAVDDDSGGNQNALIRYTATSSGTAYLEAAAYGSGTGSYRLSVAGSAPADDFAGNTSTSGRVNLGASTSGRVETANDQDWFAITLAAGQRAQFTLTSPGADPLLTLYSSAGAVLASDDDSGGNLSSLLSFTPTTAGTYYLGAQLLGGGTGAYTLSAQGAAAPADGGFTIRVVYSGDPRYQAVFDAAATRWAQVIVGDLPDVRDAQHGLIDDLLIEASVVAIDGPGSILGQAGYTARRSAADGGLPFKGIMQFDSADLAAMEAAGTLRDVVLHEMGHVLGISGQLFAQFGLVRNTYDYIGADALAAYRQLAGNLGLSSVPLERGGGQGTAGSHFAENIFRSELMTGYAEPRPPMPLSILTVGVLDDLGYVVNYAAADLFNLS